VTAILLQKDPPPARTAVLTRAATAILDVAEKLAQTRGYNGFSYADIAAHLGVTKASLHYHFRSKAELGRALIERYGRIFGAALAAIDRQTQAPEAKLRRYVELYHSVLSNERMCLCGMLAAEYATLPKPMQEGLKRFFDANERWLSTVLEEGLRTQAFAFKRSAKERAWLILGALEGAMLVARSYGEPRRFMAAAASVLADLRARRRSAPRRTALRSTSR
jgi:TetR/AcrR family transcriptional regulator, transcriptional repressor for nem operon